MTMSMSKPNYTYKDIIYIFLLIASAGSGFLIDKTNVENRLAEVERLAEKNAAKLEKANLGLILWRMNQMDKTMTAMGRKVDDLDTKMDDSTKDIITALENRRNR